MVALLTLQARPKQCERQNLATKGISPTCILVGDISAKRLGSAGAGVRHLCVQSAEILRAGGQWRAGEILVASP